MTVKRNGNIGSRWKITPAAIAAWKAGDWDGVYFGLSLRPWWPHPFDVDENAAPPTPEEGNPWTEDYPMIQELRREMIALAGEPPQPKENIDGDY